MEGKENARQDALGLAGREERLDVLANSLEVDAEFIPLLRSAL